MNKLEEVTYSFSPITLAEMDGVKLLNRTDTKFVFSTDSLPDILEAVKPHYRVLQVKELRLNRYKTLYFDTPDFEFYTKHQNGKLNRYKVRIRKYLDSDLCFLEIKFKNNKGRTVKTRKRIADFDPDLNPDNKGYIDEVVPGNKNLIPTLWNSFTRITLVSNVDAERLTIDTQLGFETPDNKTNGMPKITIAEVKQAKQSRNSSFVRTISEMGIHPMGFSKYCMGTALMYPNLKYNNFKPRFRTINKISNELVY